MSRIISYIKNWILPISMLLGVVSYLLCDALPLTIETRHLMTETVAVVQPVLIFAMLFLTFCKIKFGELHFCHWHIGLLLIQSISFIVGAILCTHIQSFEWKLFVESFIICMICPTATAAAVVTSKLGGNPATLTTYTILINLVTALVLPTFVPMIHPSAEHTFLLSFLTIIIKVFPFLFGPFLLAMILRRFNHNLTDSLAKYHNLAFYLWAVALALAIAVTTKTISHTHCPISFIIIIACASALSCAMQFALGRHIGKKHREPISATQSLGQKNTVFAIWAGFTFMTPITSLAGGFYSIWHNVYNSWQLYRQRREEAHHHTPARDE